MVFGLLLSIYLRIESANGNLHSDVEIIRNSEKYFITSDGIEVNSLIIHDLSYPMLLPDDASFHKKAAPSASIFGHLQAREDADIFTNIDQRT